MLHAFGRTWVVEVPWSRLLSLGLRTAFGWELVENAFDYWVTKVSSFDREESFIHKHLSLSPSLHMFRIPTKLSSPAFIQKSDISRYVRGHR